MSNIEEAHTLLLTKTEAAPEPIATKIYDTPARFYARSGTSTALGIAGYFGSLLLSGHPNAAQSSIITGINTVEGFGKTYGQIEYEKWWSTKQFDAPAKPIR